MRHPEHYPVEWKELALEIKQANHWQCQQCGVQCLRMGEGKELTRSMRARYTLTIAHYTPDYFGGEVFVMALCAPCHLRFDASLHRGVRFYHIAQRRQAAGQLRFDFMRTVPQHKYYYK